MFTQKICAKKTNMFKKIAMNFVQEQVNLLSNPGWGCLASEARKTEYKTIVLKKLEKNFNYYRKISKIGKLIFWKQIHWH